MGEWETFLYGWLSAFFGYLIGLRRGKRNPDA